VHIPISLFLNSCRGLYAEKGCAVRRCRAVTSFSGGMPFPPLKDFLEGSLRSGMPPKHLRRQLRVLIRLCQCARDPLSPSCSRIEQSADVTICSLLQCIPRRVRVPAGEALHPSACFLPYALWSLAAAAQSWLLHIALRSFANELTYELIA
jgi:hypothetical protein